MLKNPTDGMKDMLVEVDRHVNQSNGNQSIDFVQTHMVAAQVKATAALVHAVREQTAVLRELAEAVRALQPPPPRERTGKANV